MSSFARIGHYRTESNSYPGTVTILRATFRSTPRQVAPVIAGLLLLGCTTRHIEPKRILDEADRLALLSNFPRAAPLFDQAATLLETSGDHRDALYARLGYLWATAETGAGPKAKVDAERYFADPLIRADSALMLRSLVARAARDRVISEGSARPMWERIHELAKSIGDARWQARAEAELGQIAYLEGDVSTAVRMFKQALLSQMLHRDTGAVLYYNSMVGNGLVEAGQPQNGLGYCNAVIKMASLFADAGFPYLAYQGKARALIALQRLGEADQVLQTALTQAHARGNHFAEAQLLVVAGEGAQDRKKAVEFLRSANELSERHGFDHVFAWSALELAKAYRDRGDLAMAETYVSRGLLAMGALDDKYHLPQHLAFLAELKVLSGNFDAADQLYARAADVIDAVLVNAPSRQIESSLVGTLSGLYLEHFALAATKLKNVRKAYLVIERARGRSLADALRSEEPTPRPTDPVTSAAQRQINTIQLALLHENEPSKRQNLLDQLFETEQAFTPIDQPSPTLRTALKHVRPVSLSNLQLRIHPDEVVLEYVLAEPRSYCIRVTRADARIVMLSEGKREIEQAVDRYVSEVLAGRPAAENGRWLYDVLLRPLVTRNDSSKLIVVPDGKLNFLPVDSLVDDDGRRVLEFHAVSYCPSGTVLVLMRSNTSNRNPNSRFLGVGDVQYPSGGKSSNLKKPRYVPKSPDFLAGDTRGFGALPNTRDEVIMASRAFRWDSKLLLGRAATEASVKSQPLAGFDVIHIATHAVPSVEFPDRAALVLAPDTATGEDGLLQAREIRALPIRAELVVLSACDTGIGSLEGQEGIQNLVRAFLFAGAESVVASLWAATDTYTTYLMTQFYGHLAGGEDRSVALQHAKLDSLRKFAGSTVPFYWAGFEIIGDGSSPIATARKNGSYQHSTR